MKNTQEMNILSKQDLISIIGQIKNAAQNQKTTLKPDDEKIIRIAASLQTNNKEVLNKYHNALNTILVRFNNSNAAKKENNNSSVAKNMSQHGIFAKKVHELTLEQQKMRAKLEKQEATQAQKETIYPGGFTFNDFNQSGCLVKINNPSAKKQQYLYYNKNMIKDSLADIDQQKFDDLVNSDNLKFVNRNQAGIKEIGSNGKMTCALSFGNKAHEFAVTHELKINNSADRLAIINLKGNDTLPNIFVVTHHLKNGVHDNQHNGKKTICALPAQNTSDSKNVQMSNSAFSLRM